MQHPLIWLNLPWSTLIFVYNMNQLVLSALAFIAGVLLALQGGLNARLGVLLRHPLLATVVAFCSSAAYALLLTVVSVRNLPGKTELTQVPPYLWFTGGLCSAAGILLINKK